MTIRLRLTLAAEAAALGRVRTALRRWCEENGIGDERWRRELLVVASELCTNAVEAAPASASVRLHAWTQADRVWLQVDDDGPGLELRADEVLVPPPHLARGRGLLIVRSLTDRVEAGRDGDSTWVRVSRRL